MYPGSTLYLAPPSVAMIVNAMIAVGLCSIVGSGSPPIKMDHNGPEKSHCRPSPDTIIFENSMIFSWVGSSRPAARKGAQGGSTPSSTAEGVLAASIAQGVPELAS